MFCAATSRSEAPSAALTWSSIRISFYWPNMETPTRHLTLFFRFPWMNFHHNQHTAETPAQAHRFLTDTERHFAIIPRTPSSSSVLRTPLRLVSKWGQYVSSKSALYMLYQSGRTCMRTANWLANGVRQRAVISFLFSPKWRGNVTFI